MKVFERVAVIGAGSYGTAISQCFSGAVKNVTLVSHSASTESSINKLHMNIKSLPGICLNNNVSCVHDFDAVLQSDVVFIAVPVHAVESVCNQLKDYKVSVPVVLCSKGFDIENGRLLSELVESIIPNEIAIFSGPSFAQEIAKGLPAGVSIASKNLDLAQRLSSSLSSGSFQMEPLEDVVGLQIAGAMKNILAVGCGVISGLNLGNSAVAQLIVKGVREMMVLSRAIGGKDSTFFAFGGLGDIVLTCTSTQSRNVSFGMYLAKGGKLDDWEGCLSEGTFAAKGIPVFMQKYKVDLPVFSTICGLIHGTLPLPEAIIQLLS